MDNIIRLTILFSVICFVCPQLNNGINSVVNVDLMIPSNSQNHKTQMFYRTTNPPQLLIVRQGGTFTFRIHLKSPFFRSDRLQLHFKFETKQGPYNVFIPSKPSPAWNAKFQVNSNTIDVQVALPIDVPVGFWDLYIYTYQNKLDKFNSYLVKDILVLFNPWLPAGSVYMQSATDINEYILNEFGYIVTIDTVMTRKPWVYGQFKTSVIQALKIVLSKLNLSPRSRADPVKVSRALSSIVNFHDNYGMMAGKWKGPYELDLFGYITRSPLLWMGSPEIFEEYIKNNGQVIGFAQCWVYASLITSFGRALGIPSRVVTNFESGHDFDRNATISFKFDSNGDLDVNSSESIWNFHVWAEMWMKRSDLSSDGWTYGGWQILDGTPQQRSYDTIEADGNHWLQLGPASRVAVKRGEILKKYDTRFVYAEVNADIIYRNYLNEVINVDISRVGSGTYTKGPNGQLIDVTLAYKDKENTISERTSFNKVLQQIYTLSPITARASKVTVRDFRVKMRNTAHKKMGSVIDFVVTVMNDFIRARHFDVSINAYSLYYNGQKGHTIYNIKYQLNLNAFSQNENTILISPEKYIYKLVPFSIVRIDISIRTPQRSLFKQMFDLILQNPALIINPIGTAVIGKPFYVDVKIINPLTVPLTKCVFSIHGLRLSGDVHYVKTVLAKETKLFRFALVFKEPINEFIAIQFNSAEMDQIAGHIQVPVKSR